MKNPFTMLNQTRFDKRTIDKIEARRRKDAGTKKETHRGKGGGGSSASSVGDHAIDKSGKVKINEPNFKYRKRYRDPLYEMRQRRSKEQIEKRNKQKIAKKSKRKNRR